MEGNFFFWDLGDAVSRSCQLHHIFYGITTLGKKSKEKKWQHPVRCSLSYYMHVLQYAFIRCGRNGTRKFLIAAVMCVRMCVNCVR